MRQSQEAVELSLKAALRLIGIDYPKWHDVGGVLEKEKARFPVWFQDKTSTLAKISAFLAAQREASMYGNDLSKKDPASLFTVHDARKALKETCQVFALVQKLVNKARKKP